MNLKEYIKVINEYLLSEDFEEGTSETMEDKTNKLQDLKARFEAFLEKVEKAGLSIEDIQNAASGQGGAPTPAPAAPAALPAQ